MTYQSGKKSMAGALSCWVGYSTLSLGKLFDICRAWRMRGARATRTQPLPMSEVHPMTRVQTHSLVASVDSCMPAHDPRQVWKGFLQQLEACSSSTDVSMPSYAP